MVEKSSQHPMSKMFAQYRVQSVEPCPHSPPVTELYSANKWFTNDANNYDALLIC